MKNPSTGSTRARITKSAERILLVLCHLGAWAIVPLLAFWPAGDPHPQATAMFLAVQRGDLSAIDEALRGGLDVDSRDEIGVTPLMAAARAGQIDAVRSLLAAGAGIDVCVPVFGTPLMVATMNGQHDVMRELVACGVNMDAANPTGQTALWYARMNEDEEAVRILIAGGAVAEGHATREPEVIAQGEGLPTPSETRAIKTANLAAPVSGAGSEKGQTSVQSAQ